MKVTGIIAEYNPFHMGHQYQIHTLRETYHPDYIVAALSGDFLQRGTPAFVDKYARAHMALLQGVDLVLELPACFSTASAELFAQGGVALLHATGLVDSLCFGTETPDLAALQTAASILQEEPTWYKDALLSYLKEGYSFPVARSKALPEFSHILDTPNNILALEYLKAIKGISPKLAPLPVLRAGSGYHDKSLASPLASASAIRDGWFSNKDLSGLSEFLPETSYELLSSYHNTSVFLQEDDFSLLLHHALLLETVDSLQDYQDITPALANRLLEKRKDFVSWSSFCQLCNSKDMTYSRISRALTHLLLGIKKELLAPYTAAPATPLPYLRVLGFRDSAAPLLTQLKGHAKAPVITSLASDTADLSPTGLDMLSKDIYASDLYRSVITHKAQQAYPNEYQRKLLVEKAPLNAR